MTEQVFTLTLTPGLDVSKQDVVIGTTIVDPADNTVSIGYGSTVREGRGTEITNAIRFLLSGVRDRNLIEAGAPDFKGLDLVTVVDIDRVTAADRRTSSTLTGSSVTNNDVVLTMDALVTTLQHRNIIDNAFEMIRRAVQEFLYKNG